MDPTGLTYAAAGLAALLAAVLPRLISRAPVSMPMIFLGAGVVAFATIEWLPNPDPLAHGGVVEHVTEACVIISLMGAGLALDRPPGLRRWGSTWRLLGIAMPLTMLAAGLLGGWALGLPLASAILLAAVLAPTDPVLASEVQVAEPSDAKGEEEDEVRFALTSEAGLNDGLAFPFTYAAIAVAMAGAAPSGWLGRWVALDVLWRLAIGVGVGLVIGWLLGKLFFTVRWDCLRLAEHGEGFVALACTFAAYGVAELAEGYGFVAVFVCACTVRAAERDHGYHKVLHQYVEQLERLLTIVILVLLGGAVARGLFADVTWAHVLVAAVFLLLVRPLAGWTAMAGSETDSRERAVIAFFGVRGVGSLYYLAYGLGQASFGQPRSLWAITGLVVVGSVVVHGMTAGPAMAFLDDRRRASLRRAGVERPAP